MNKITLPKINLPLFEIEIPSTKQRITFRPFTVREEKILLIAQESKDINQIVIAIQQIINNCANGVNVNELAVFDLEYLLLNIRAKSVTNELSFTIKDAETESDVDLIVDINDIKIHTLEKHSKHIQLDEHNHLIMRYPSLQELRDMTTAGENVESLFNIMIACIDTLISDDSVYKMTDFNKEEIIEFVNNLTSQHIDSIKDFFETMPALRYEKTYINSAGNTKTFVIEGTESFFI